MRAISGLIIPNSGTINIDGEILGKDISFPRSIGILIENPSFLGNYTGYKNLEMLASIQKRIGEDEIRETLAEVGLDPDDKRTYRKYSLGMKQRLGIAAAIMEKPDIVILDEPINALDESGALKVREILWKLRDNGSIIILACHDAEELNLLSDEIYQNYLNTEKRERRKSARKMFMISALVIRLFRHRNVSMKQSGS